MQKIPEKFYTDTKPYYVTVTYDGNTATVLNNTEAEAERIRERFNSGIPIYLKMMLNDGSFMMAPLYKKGTYGANGTGNWFYYFTMITEEGIMLVIVSEGDGETRLNATVQGI